MIKKTGFSLILAVFLVAGMFINSAAAWIPEPTDEQKEIFSKKEIASFSENPFFCSRFP